MVSRDQTPAVMGWEAFVAARTRAIRGLTGTVLELGAGQGENFSAFTPGVQWLGLEPSSRFRRTLAERARHAGHHQPPIAATAEAIPLDDASVTNVMATTVLCSVTDPGQVLQETARVLTPGGQVVLAEHVAAPTGSYARRAQRLVKPFTKFFDHGCDPTRDTEAAVHNSDLTVQDVSRFYIRVLGRLHIPFVVITAQKPAMPQHTQD